MIYDSEMMQNGAVVSGMHTDGDANMNDLDASLFSALSMDGSNLITANAGNSFIDSLTGSIGDELNLPFSELDSLVNGANGAGECSLAQLTSSLEFELMSNTAPHCGTALPQVPMRMVTTRNSDCASPPNSNQALRRLLTESQSAATNGGAANTDADLCDALRMAEAEGEKPQRSDLNSTLLQLLIRQQIQQTEQRRILERLQSAILSNDKNAITAACLESEPKSPALSVSASVVTTTSTSSNPNANASSMNGQQQHRTGHIQALLETSSPPPNGTAAMRQYAHLSQNELRQTLISTDYQQQMKRGVNVSASANGNSNSNSNSNSNLAASTPQRNGGGQPARVAVGNASLASLSINGNANVSVVRNTSGTGAVPISFGGSFQPTLAPAQPQLVSNIVKCETASSIGAYDRRRSGTSTAATSPTSRQPLSAFASSIAGDSEDCCLAQDQDDDADSYSQPTASATGQNGSGWASVSGGARRSAHNVIEKRYRSSINDRIGELRQIVAANQPKIQKSGVLRKTVEYIHHLRSQNETLRNENAALKQALLGATANASSRYDAAVLSNCRDGNVQNEGDTMLIQADSPNAFECYADTQPVSNLHSQGSPQLRADLMNAPSPPDTMMSSPDVEPPRQIRSPPRAAPRAGAQPSKQVPVAPKPIAVAPATQKLNAVLSGRQLACAALDRTKLMLCVVMVTFVAVNPLDLVTQRVSLGASPSAVDHFSASSLGHAHAHGDFDFAEAHAGARILSSYESQPQLMRDDSRSSILRLAAIWLINLLVIVAILRRVLSFRCAKCTEDDCSLAQTDKLDADTDSAFARFKTQADGEFASRNFDDARASYKLALASAGCPCDDAADVTPLRELASFIVAYAVNSVRPSTQPSVPLTHLCTVYSRLLLLHLRADESMESHATLRLALSTFRGVRRVHACGKNDCVADAYLAVTCATLALSRNQDNSIVRFALRRVAKLAFNSARNVSPNDVLRNERFAAFLFDHALRSATLPSAAGLSLSLTELLTGAFLRSLLVGCTSVLREGDGEAAQEELQELGRLCQPMEQECEYQFWHAATTLFVQFERNWHDAAQRGVSTLNRISVRDQLKQQTLLLDALKRLDSLLQHVATDCDGAERAVLASGRVASPRTVSVAHLVYRAVRALVVLSSSSQPRSDAFEKLRTYLNSLSKTLQSVRKVVREETDVDSLELNVAQCAAKWAVILRVMLCALHREHAAKVSSTSQGETVQMRKTMKRKWIVECQTDLDTYAELNATRASDEQTDSARGDELEQFEECLHELADSNPLQSVYVRMRVLAA